MWAVDEDDDAADHATPFPSTSTAATHHHNQDDSNSPPNKIQKMNKWQKGKAKQ